jgi:hypothetical protein
VSDVWEHRELCPDGACVGLIGPDGLCKVCGRAAPNWGDERQRGMIEEPTEASQDEGPVIAGAAPSESGDGEWSDRKLCPDGSCVGVIGDNGKCKVCGRSAA